MGSGTNRRGVEQCRLRVTSRRLRLRAGARRIAAQIVEILNGGIPAEMPYFQESHWELVINLKAAKELGLEIPAGVGCSC